MVGKMDEKNSLGLARGTVMLQEYNPEWKKFFDIERKMLLGEFPDVFLEISHGGSTSVPGMKAKPIIDMFVAVSDLDDYKKVKSDLEALGYEYRGEEGVPGRQLFVKGDERRRTHHLQLTTKNNDQWKNHILLREYYIKHPQVMREYVALKEELASKYSNDRGSYSSGKNEFIDLVLKKAKEESGLG